VRDFVEAGGKVIAKDDLVVTEKLNVERVRREKG
jgi:hypothetical protein